MKKWKAGNVLHVLHDTLYDPGCFNPGIDAKGRTARRTRFAPILDSSGKLVPYFYGGSTLECAIYETVFHDVPFEKEDKLVDLSDYKMRAHGAVIANRDLNLVDLTSPGLHRLGMTNQELIESTAFFYPQTAAWAAAFYAYDQGVDGLLWMSRQHNPSQAVVLFGDRLSGVLTGRRIGASLETDLALRDAVIAAALDAGIVVT